MAKPSIEDRLAIEDLFVRYTTALDNGDVDGVVSCFWGWGLFIAYNVLAVTYSKTAVLLAFLMMIFAMALAS